MVLLHDQTEIAHHTGASGRLDCPGWQLGSKMGQGLAEQVRLRADVQAIVASAFQPEGHAVGMSARLGDEPTHKRAVGGSRRQVHDGDRPCQAFAHFGIIGAEQQMMARNLKHPDLLSNFHDDVFRQSCTTTPRTRMGCTKSACLAEPTRGYHRLFRLC